MPSGTKQRKQNYNHIRPQGGYVHPSLGLRPAPVATTRSIASDGAATVNERIEHLRRTQNQQVSPVNVQDHVGSIRVQLTERRRIAGPPPPRSWTEDPERREHAIRIGVSRGADYGRRPRALDYFPGHGLPDKTSLIHHTLKALALDFEWHVEYDHYYLSVLPVKLKGILLSYVCYYGPQDGLTKRSLKVLFASPDRSELSGSSGTDGLNRLDLGGSIGRHLSLKELQSLWHSRKTQEPSSADNVPEFWDSPSSVPTGIDSPLRFPSLVRLSLACPGPGVSWMDLLAFSRNLSTLTHLSLAHWPIPHLASRTDALSTVSSPKNAPADNPWAEGAYILKQLSRNTPSLQYLDLDGCTHWFQALRTEAAAPTRIQPRSVRERTQFDFARRGSRDSSGVRTPPLDNKRDGVEWTGAWRHLSHVSVRQGWAPRGMNPQVLFSLYETRGKQAGHLENLVPRAQAAEREAYSMFSSSHAVRESVEAETNARYQRDAWLKMNIEALLVEAHVRHLRMEARARGITSGGNGVCSFDHGWGREELLEAGYDEHELWEAGF